MLRKSFVVLTICCLLPGSGVARDGGWRFAAVKPDTSCGNTEPLDSTEQMFMGLLVGERRILAKGPDGLPFEAALTIKAKGAFEGDGFPEDLCLASVTMQIGDETSVGQLQILNQPPGEHRGYPARILFGEDAPISQITLRPVNDLRFFGDIYFRQAEGSDVAPFGGWSQYLEDRRRE